MFLPNKTIIVKSLRRPDNDKESRHLRNNYNQVDNLSLHAKIDLTIKIGFNSFDRLI